MDLDQHLFVALQRTADWLLHDTQAVLKSSGLSAQQYNVLRILRGAKQPLNCTEIANRMINRDPDMTRLLDRLESRGWIERLRDGADRRVVLVAVTPGGLALLAALDGPVRASHQRQFAALDDPAKRAVIDVLNLLFGKEHQLT